MLKTFELQKREIKKLHKKYEEYFDREFSGKHYFGHLSNPDNFVDGVYYHQANSFEERRSILDNGFDENKVSNSNCGVGRGLYLGRDKKALTNFYSVDVNNPQDFTIKIKGNFHFFNLMDDRKFMQEHKENLEAAVFELGYDGIRYYDPDATGEEFVLFNYSKILIEK